MMKRFLCMMMAAALMMALMCACNRSVVDVTLSYDYGYILLPTGDVVEGKVDSWMDYDDGDQLQVTIDGKTYLAHATNVILVKN